MTHQQPRDQSVQFSLKELMKLEDERLVEQERDREAREQAALEVKAEAERRERQDFEAKERARAEEDAKRRHAENDDVARREAMQKAIVEQARLEVEARARAEERDRERRHELEIQKLKIHGGGGAVNGSSASPAIARTIVSGVGGAVVMLAFTLGLHFGIAKPSSERQVAALTQTLASADQRADDADKRTADQRRSIENLEKVTSDQKEEIANLKKDLAAAKKATTNTPAPKTGVIPARPRQPTEADCPGGSKDPMCFALPK